jgi:NAD(P)H-quinone oxidoreductase subunit I
MRIATMLRDVLRALVRRPVTERYPLERRRRADRFRGALTFDPSRCTGCCLCEKDCPADALDVIMVDRANKRFVVKYHIDRCTYCAQCVQSCRFGCLGMSSDQWELAALGKEPFVVHYGRDADVEAVLAKRGRSDAQPAADRIESS